MVTLGTLGPIYLRDGKGSELNSVLSQPKRLALLAYLAVAYPGAYARRDILLSLFWPESSNSHARNALSQSLTYLRQNLPGGVIRTRGTEEVGVDPEALWTDVEGFDTAFAESRWAEVLDLYRGDFLSGLHLSNAAEFDEWIEGERSRLKKAAAQAAWTLAHQQIQRSALLEAERTARRALALAWADEGEVVRFMEALAAGGDRAAALQWFQEYCALLAVRLEVEPSARTVAAVEEIRNGEIGSAPAGTPGAQADEPADGFPASSPLTHIGSTEERTDSAPPAAPWWTPSSLSRRTRRWSFPLAGLAALGIALALLLAPRTQSTGGRTEREVVLVLPFSNHTGDPALEPHSRRAAVAISERLAWVHGVNVVPWTEVLVSWPDVAEGEPVTDLDGRSPAEGLIRDYNPDIVIGGSVFPGDGEVRFEAEIHRPGLPKWAPPVLPVVVPLDSLETGVEGVARTVMGALAFHLNEAWAEQAPYMSPMPSVEVMEDFSRAWQLSAEGHWTEAVRLAERVLERAPGYLPAVTGLAVCYLNLGDLSKADSILDSVEDEIPRMAPYERRQWEWARAHLDGNRLAAYTAMKSQLDQVPTPILRYTLGFEALRLNRPREALEALSSIDPDHPRVRALEGYWYFRSEALHGLGRHREELRAANQGRARHPGNWPSFGAQLRAHVALGNRDEILAILEEAILGDVRPAFLAWRTAHELRGHGDVETSREVGIRGLEALGDLPEDAPARTEFVRSRARLLYVTEQWTAARKAAETLLEVRPGYPDALGLLGGLAARRGDETEARRFERLLAELEEPFLMGRNTHWRGHIAALLGEKDRAVSLLRQAHGEGMELTQWFFHHLDLEPLVGYPPFEELRRPKG